jgi:mediator of RNA polymerase II transcription subunit 12
MRNPVPHGFKGVELLDSMFSPITTPNNRPTGPGQGVRPPSDPIPIDRAVWFIRVLGANEITAHRGRLQPSAQNNAVSIPSPVPATPSSNNTIAVMPAVSISSNAWYTQEFTNTFTSWMRTQLVQMALPANNKGPAKPGAPPPKPPAGILGDDKARARWMAKWQYT